MMMLIMIWAEDANGLIGSNGQLPWHLPNDLKFFKENTLHQTIVMGKTTFEGMGKRLLPKRQTIVMTRDVQYACEGGSIVHTIQDVLALAQTQDVYIVGGAQLYQLFAPYAHVLLQTVIHHTFDGDTYFPKIDFSLFTLVSQTEGAVDDQNHYAHTFKKYERKG